MQVSLAPKTIAKRTNKQQNMEQQSETNTLNNLLTNETTTTIQKDILFFEDSGNTAQQTLSQPKDEHVINAERLNDIQDQMSRPFRAGRVKYTVNSSVGATLAVFRVITYLRSTMPNYIVSKYYSFKADIVIQLRANAQPFHTGGVQLSYIPPCIWTDDISFTPYTRCIETMQNTGARVPFLAGLPSVDLDVSRETTVTLRIPYKYVSDMNPTNFTNMGGFLLVPLQPLGSKIPADFVEMTAYMWMENFRVEGVNRSNLGTYYAGLQAPVFTDAKQLQAGISKAKEAGMMSKASSTVANVAGTLSKIPLISDIAGPVSIAADIASKAFSFFGLSKPVTQEPIVNVQTNRAFGHVNTDGVFCGTKMSINRNQEIEMQQLGWEEEDEMSIKYIATKYAKWGAFRWSLSTPGGTRICNFSLIPSLFSQNTYSENVGPVACWTNTYLSYLSHMFALFRGSLKFRLTFFANAFYSGRIKIVWQPQPSGNDPATAMTSDVQDWTMIYDLKDANQFEFTIPWVFANDWCETRAGVRYDVGRSMGRIVMMVENELRTNAQCPDSIWCWVEVAGGDDIEFAVPLDTEQDPPNPAYVAPSVVKELQAGISIGDQQQNAKNNMQSIGDPIGSLRNLLKRYHPVEDLALDQDSLQMYYRSANDATPFNWVTRMYGFMTGGMRLWLPNPKKDMTVSILAGRMGDEYNADRPGRPDNNDRLCRTYFRADDILDVELPYYNTFPRVAAQSSCIYKPNATTSAYRNIRSRVGYEEPLTTVTFYPVEGPTTPITGLYRAVADDFNCGLLLGPRMTAKQAGSNAQLDAVSTPPTLAITAP